MYLEKRGFVIFLQWPTFWDFNDTRLLNYIPSGIRICRYYGGFFFNQVLAPSSSDILSRFQGQILLSNNPSFTGFKKIKEKQCHLKVITDLSAKRHKSFSKFRKPVQSPGISDFLHFFAQISCAIFFENVNFCNF